MKQLVEVTFKQFYETNERVVRTSPMRVHYGSKNPFERYIWRQKLRGVKEMLTSISYGSVLDVGCGDGQLLEVVDGLADYTGLDISPTQLAYFRSQLDRLRGKRRGKRELVQADAHSLPFPQSSFDLVLACDILEHVLNPERVLREIRRVLKEGGYALFSLPNEPLWQLLRLLALRWPPRSPDHLYFIEKKDVTRFFPVVKNEIYIPPILSKVYLIHLLLVEKRDKL